MNFKELIKSRRGVAIELAIGVMFLLMAFTIILLTTAGLQNSSLIKDRDSFYDKVELDQIGEEACLEFVERNKNNQSLDGQISLNDEYYMTVVEVEDVNVNTIYHKINIFRDEEAVLVIEISENGKIISWN